MNRSFYWDLCEERFFISLHPHRVKRKIEYPQLPLACRGFLRELPHVLFGYKLKNMNAVAQNAEGIDLIDTVNALVLQVSSTASKTKIESALAKDLAAYKKYRFFNFVAISKDASELRKQNFLNPHGLALFPLNDIHDIKSILSFILHFDIDRQRVIYDFQKNYNR